MVTAFERVRVQIAPGFGPMATSPTWVDVTGSLMDFSVTRGRSSPLELFGAGSWTVTFDASDGALDPRNPSGPYAGELVESLPLRIEVDPGGVGAWVPLVYGLVDTWDVTDRHPGMSVATVTGTDRVKVLEMGRVDAGSFTAVEAGARCGEVLDAAGWPAGWRDLDTGTVPMRAGVSGDAASPWDMLGRVASAEGVLAAVFVTRAGSVRFDDFGAVSGASFTSPVVTFDASAGPFVPADVGWGYFDGAVRAEASATDSRGVVHAVSDATAKATFGPVAARPDVSWLGDAAWVDGLLGGWLRSAKTERFGAKTLRMTFPTASAALLACAPLELRDRVRIQTTTPAGTAVTADHHIERISWSAGRSKVMAMQLGLFAAAWVDDHAAGSWLKVGGALGGALS